MMRWLCRLAAKFLTPRVILDRDGKTPYLSRYYIKGGPRMADGSSPFNPDGSPKKDAIWPDGIGIYLHRFHKSDADGAVHNHPWKWAISLILSGGYWEDYVDDDEDNPTVRTRCLKVFDVNRISHNTFHRVDLRDTECWSLFITGPKVSSWGFRTFYHHNSRVYASRIILPWQYYIKQARKNVNKNVS